jgi:hypothetical protein
VQAAIELMVTTAAALLVCTLRVAALSGALAANVTAPVPLARIFPTPPPLFTVSTLLDQPLSMR